jgi:hypothetical protein
MTHHSSLIIHHSSLITHHSPLTTTAISLQTSTPELRTLELRTTNCKPLIGKVTQDSQPIKGKSLLILDYTEVIAQLYHSYTAVTANLRYIIDTDNCFIIMV